MTFTTEGIRPYEINLDEPEETRWKNVMEHESGTARGVCEEALREINLSKLSYWVFGRIYRRFGELYCGELAAWAKVFGFSFGELAMVNCSYELSHLVSRPFLRMTTKFFAKKAPPHGGCTAGIVRAATGPLIHVRTLDWPLPSIAAATRLFWFSRGGHRRFVAVGIPGMVGILSGMVPGAYSATIDWAPPTATPSFDFGPTFLLRTVFESCDTYEAAVERLSRERLSTSTFFTVCGKDQGCIIERTHDSCNVREFQGTPIAQSNHFRSPEFAVHNAQLADLETEDALLRTTRQRADALENTLCSFPAGTLASDWVTSLHATPLTNEQTVQRMVFRPGTGELFVDRLVS